MDSLPSSVIDPAIVVALLVVALCVLYATGSPLVRGIVAAVGGLLTLAVGLFAIARYKPRGPDVITKARETEQAKTAAADAKRDTAVRAADEKRDAALAEDTTDWINAREKGRR